MSVEEGKVISGLRYKSETEKEEMPDKMHCRGSYCEQWNFNPTGTAEKCRECIPDKTPHPRGSRRDIYPHPPNGHDHGLWTTPRDIHSPLASHSCSWSEQPHSFTEHVALV